MDNENGVFLSVVLGADLSAGAAFDHHKQEQSGDVCAAERELVERMPEFLCDDRFRLVVQPVIDLQTGKIVGAEVLSRLEHPEQGMIFPDRFIPAIEAAGGSMGRPIFYCHFLEVKQNEEEIFFSACGAWRRTGCRSGILVSQEKK